MPDSTALRVIDSCKSLAVAMGLTFIHEGQTHERAERFTLYYKHTCIFGSDTIAPIESYLYGFRDGRTTPHPGSTEALTELVNTKHKVTLIKDQCDALLDENERVSAFITPLTRERSRLLQQ